MKKFLTHFTLFLIIATFLYISYIKFIHNWQLLGIFIGGILLGMFIMNLFLIVKNEKIKTYKRELEKESISSTESSSKIKILESKIQVLEKALENALKKD